MKNFFFVIFFITVAASSRSTLYPTQVPFEVLCCTKAPQELWCSTKSQIVPACDINHEKLKILHLTFEKQCATEIEQLGERLEFDLTTWYIPELPFQYFDGISQGDVLYNMGHERAKRIWELHHEYFEQFDAIITSYTAPLSRIFLQNGWKKPLIIWICNRFDYWNSETSDCDFPDQEYYQLFQKATQDNNVIVIASTEFEHYYAKTFGINTGLLTINHCHAYLDGFLQDLKTSINDAHEPEFYLPPYLNENELIDLEALRANLGIKIHSGITHNVKEVTNFKGIIHLPYSWNYLYQFENMDLNLPIFIPSRTFLSELAAQCNYYHQNQQLLVTNKLFYLSEWYSLNHQRIVTYFDSWIDLKCKINSADFLAKCSQVHDYLKNLQNTMLFRWITVFSKILNYKFHPETSLTGYSIIPYETLNFNEMILIKEALYESTYPRLVYWDVLSNRYVKVWSADYPSAINFLSCTFLDYYKDISPLEAIIQDKRGACRGYITKAINSLNIEIETIPNNHNFLCIDHRDRQNDLYKEFFNHLIQLNKKTGIYFFDLTPGNIAKDGEKYYLLDLESVHNAATLCELQEIANPYFTFLLEHQPVDYAQFILSITEQ